MKPLYERKAVTDLWNRLTEVSKKQWKWKNVATEAKLRTPFAGESTSRLLQVFGPPGSGKSCATYHWMECICRNLNVNAVWLSCATQEGESWAIQRIEGTGSVEAERQDVVMTNAADYEGYGVVVFDGIRGTTVDAWRGLMNDLAMLGIAVIVVSSEGVKFHEGDSSNIMKPEHMVPSWIPAEYAAASTDDTFWAAYMNKFDGATVSDNADRRRELLEEKFAVAGYSARYMYGLTAEQAISQISHDVESMGGIDALEEAVKRTRSIGFVNSLVARLPATQEDGATPTVPAVFPTEDDTLASAAGIEDVQPESGEFAVLLTVPRIVSTYAVQKVIAALPSDIKRLRAIARKLDNRAIEGYAFEEQLKKSLVEAQASETDLVVNDDVTGVSVQYPVSILSTKDASEVVAALKSSPSPNTWIFVAGRQGAFDAVHVLSATHWRFVQGTVGKSHSYRLDLIENLLRDVDNTRLTHVEFMVLRPESERGKAFSLCRQDGGNQLRFLKRFDEQHWSSADYYRGNAKQAFLEWTDII